MHLRAMRNRHLVKLVNDAVTERKSATAASKQGFEAASGFPPADYGAAAGSDADGPDVATPSADRAAAETSFVDRVAGAAVGSPFLEGAAAEYPDVNGAVALAPDKAVGEVAAAEGDASKKTCWLCCKPENAVELRICSGCHWVK